MSNPSSNQNQQTESEGRLSPHVIVIPQTEYEIRLRSVEQSTKKLPNLLNKTSGKRSCSIFRVPQNLMKIHPEAFKPQIVSIGPYHHGRKNLQTIQEHKRRFLGIVLARTQERGVSIDDFFKAIVLKEKKIRESYSETLKYNCYDLVEMMVLDGCFIMELLCVVGGRLFHNDHTEDPIFSLRWILYTLMRDFIILENQIPLFVLQTLFEISVPDSPSTLKELIVGFFKYTMPDHTVNNIQNSNLDDEHLLSLYRSSFIPTSKGEATGSRDYQSVRPIKKLLGAGIKIKIKKHAESFLDIVFKPNGVLEIPSSPSDEFSSKFLLNSVAFEQCYYYCSIHFTSYVTFMGNLINTSFDAGYLLDRGIICSGTDEDVAEFFRELKDDLFYDVGKSYLAKVIEDVNKYYRNVWNVTLAGCMYNYFGSLWVFVSAAAAFFLLLLTVTQTFFAVFAYVKPPN
ncbi:hypothetical protein JCGZ_10897 [Jatropha curcas]|uniref:Uncharacterized protein n=1 Tax=Jatropha curcas TaxID=180498 RepID=A0A067KF05_JATCU|nr:hypothetical protein JCGZ_10897 [Jatropha curcas]